MKILDRSNHSDVAKVSEVEQNITNKWVWQWMEKSVELDPAAKFPKLEWRHGPLKIMAKDHIRKIDEPGKAICTICKDSDGQQLVIRYASTGVKAVTSHLSSKRHVSNIGSLVGNQVMPGAVVPNNMYGAPTLFFAGNPTLATSIESVTVPSALIVHVLDRVANFEAMVVAFLAEHSLPLSLSSDLIELAKELAKDPSALKKLKLHRTTASYKLTHGLSLTWRAELIENLRTTHFSLNMDESTSSNTKHVFTVLVTYYDKHTEEITVDHLGSVDVPSCTSENIYIETKKLIERVSIPWTNLLAILADSASTMRGKIGGVETLIRDNDAPHMLDIDGDSCHHVHNIVKKFTSFFGYFLENLFRDLSNEFKLSPDSLDLYREATFLMNLKFRKPIDYHSIRWLSVYDASIEFHNYVDVHKVYFSACEHGDLEQKQRKCEQAIKNLGDPKPSKEPVSCVKMQSLKELKKEKKELSRLEEKRSTRVANVFKKCKLSDESVAALAELEPKIISKFKTATDKGKERKRRIISSLLHQPNYYTLLTSFYQTVLPLFKSYVILFQGLKPLIHKVYLQQVAVVKTFFSYFVKPDILEKCKKGKDLLALDLDKKNLLPRDLIYVGSKAKKVINKLGADHAVVQFMDKVEESYLQCGVYIQKKLPLENDVLKSFGMLDPMIVSSSCQKVLRYLLKLPSLITTVLSEEEEDTYDQEARAICVDSDLPSAIVDGVEVECLVWWKSVSAKYPTMFKIVRSVLSIFHGPAVESTFSVMGDVIDTHSGKMNMETYSAFQDVKYGLKARKPNVENKSVKVFAREERLHTPVDTKLSTNMRNAYKRYGDRLREKRKADEERRKKYGVVNPKSLTTKKLKENAAQRSEKDTEEHQSILMKAYNLKRLKTPTVACAREKPVRESEVGDVVPVPIEVESEVETVVSPVQKSPVNGQSEEEVVVVSIEDEDMVDVQPKQKKTKRKGETLSAPIPFKKKKTATLRKRKSLHDFFKKQT